jgi:hypothetical protein
MICVAVCLDRIHQDEKRRRSAGGGLGLAQGGSGLGNL